MAVKKEIGQIVSRRLVPVVADLERVVHRNGYLRVLTVTITLLGLVGLLGQLLGLPWLRFAYGTLAAILFVLASAVSFAGTQLLRERVTRSETVLHSYADALNANHPLEIWEWKQDVFIEPNGDASMRRHLVLGAASSDGPPRHLRISVLYYGKTAMTDRDKRRVSVKVLHTEATGTNNTGIRVASTSTWKASSSGEPQLDVYVHLGEYVKRGDVVMVEWDWPRYSADLMSGRSSEIFDVLFDKEVENFTHTVTFRSLADPSRLQIQERNAPDLERIENGKDVTIRFAAANPELHKLYGFIADYHKHN